MKKLLCLLCVLGIMGFSCSPSVERVDVIDDTGAFDNLPELPSGNWIDGVNAAGWDFHRSLNGNAVSSPLSIGVAFSLARAGAAPSVGEDLDNIFWFPEVGTHDAAWKVLTSLAEASADPNVLEVATGMFIDSEFTPLENFVGIAENYYMTTLKEIDKNNSSEAANTINGWVAEKTRDLIPKIVNEGNVGGKDMILANTVYLKADWNIPFNEDKTEEDGEFNTGDEIVTAPLMFSETTRRYVQLTNADAVELLYKGDKLAMWIVVPHDTDGLGKAESALNHVSLLGLSNEAQTGRVRLTMPRWEQTLPSVDLFEWLCPQSFCPKAAFPGIAPTLVIDTALHSAKVIVDEKSTEAAAATVVGGHQLLSVYEPPPEPDLIVEADHPFLWAIVHQDTGALLFVGRLVDPTTA